MLEQGRIRNAAEKAWSATKRATDALARTREEPERYRSGTGAVPERSSESSTGLRMLESLDPEVRRARLVRRTTHGRATCRGTASMSASASPSRRLSGGSGRRPTTCSDVIEIVVVTEIVFRFQSGSRRARTWRRSGPSRALAK